MFLVGAEVLLRKIGEKHRELVSTSKIFSKPKKGLALMPKGQAGK